VKGPAEVRSTPSSVWAQYLSNMLLVATVLGGIGLRLLGLSLLPAMAKGTRGAALGDLTGAAITTLVGLWWRRKRPRSAL
jgi:hypothetical protein